MRRWDGGRELIGGHSGSTSWRWGSHQFQDSLWRWACERDALGLALSEGNRIVVGRRHCNDTFYVPHLPVRWVKKNLSHYNTQIVWSHGSSFSSTACLYSNGPVCEALRHSRSVQWLPLPVSRHGFIN